MFSVDVCAHRKQNVRWQGNSRRHSFDIFLIDANNQPSLVYVGRSGGQTRDMETFSLGDRAGEVGYRTTYYSINIFIHT